MMTPAASNAIKIELIPPPNPPIPPPANMVANPAPIANPANGPIHLLPLEAGAGAGAAVGARCACLCGIERLLPKLLPPPKRFASATVDNRLIQVKATISTIKNFLMRSSLN